jgi:hypothetical protein
MVKGWLCLVTVTVMKLLVRVRLSCCHVQHLAMVRG